MPHPLSKKGINTTLLDNTVSVFKIYEGQSDNQGVSSLDLFFEKVWSIGALVPIGQ